MRRRKFNSIRKGEEGVVVVLVAVFLLFVVAAMAALSVDLVTFYTARSEAQRAADGAALAGARVLANSGMTSADPMNTLLASSAEDSSSHCGDAGRSRIREQEWAARSDVSRSAFNETIRTLQKPAHYRAGKQDRSAGLLFAHLGRHGGNRKRHRHRRSLQSVGIEHRSGVAPSVSLTLREAMAAAESGSRHWRADF